MVGNAWCDAEWVPMTPHTSWIHVVRDTQEYLWQAYSCTDTVIWPPLALRACLGMLPYSSTAGTTAFSCCIPVYSPVSSSRAACRGIQLYSGIQRYTVYSSTAVYSIQRSTFPLSVRHLTLSCDRGDDRRSLMAWACPGRGGLTGPPRAPQEATVIW